MPTKVELQAAFEHCERIRRQAAAELQKSDVPAALKIAETALRFQHSAATFQRRFLDVAAPAAPIIDLILRKAPAYFQGRLIDSVETWHLGGTKSERTALPDIPNRVAESRNLLARAVELWSALVESPAVVVRVGDDARSNALLRIWVAAAVVAPHPNDPSAIIRVSDGRRDAVSKCSTCGFERRAPLAESLEPSPCASCGRRNDFVLIRRVL